MNKNTALRSVLSVLLAVVMVTTGNLVSFSRSTGHIDGFLGEFGLEKVFSLGQSGDYTNLEVRAGDEIRIPLTADMFSWSDDRTPLPREAITTTDLRKGPVTVGTRTQSGNITLDYVQFDTDVFSGKPFYLPGTATRTGKTAYISIMLAEDFVSVKDKDFSIDLFMRIDGKDTHYFTVSGTMMVDLVEIGGEDNDVFLGGGLVAEATSFAKDVSFDLDNGITIKKNAVEGQRYYGISKMKHPYDHGFEEEFAEKFPAIYPSLEFVYKLQTVNMRSGSCKVTLSPGDTLYHVYGEDMRYLGTSKDELPYSDYYFMALEQIPTLEMTPYEDGLSAIPNWDRGGDDGDINNPNSGGDEGFIPNANGNPNTGR